MLRQINWSLLLYVLVFWVFLIEVKAQCPNFTPPILNSADIHNKYKNSVILLRCGNSRGTGFFINKDGYLLTAYHVIKPGGKIYGTIDGLNFLDTLYFKEIQSIKSDEVDVSLLCVTNLQVWNQYLEFISPIEVTFRQPDFGWNYFSLSYPIIDDALYLFEPTYQGFDKSNLIKVKADTYKGSSGAPLMDRHGNAIGVIIEHSSDIRFAYCSPTYNFQILLDQIPLANRFENLDEQLRTIVITQDELSVRLKPSLDHQFIENTDFYVWVNRILKNKANYTSAELLLFCPIIQAYADRLNDFNSIVRLSKLLPDKVNSIARDWTKKGVESFSEGNNGDAEFALRTAVALYENEFKYTVDNIEEALKATSVSQIHLIVNSELIAKDKLAKEYVAYNLKDYARCNYYLSKILGQKGVNNSNFELKATNFALLASQTTNSEFVRADIYTLVGDIQNITGDKESSRVMYANAYNLGKKDSWVISNYNYLSTVTKNTSGISNEPIITKENLTGYIISRNNQ